MGREKERIEETETAWERIAQVESIRCTVCSHQVHYCDREIFM